MERTEVPAAIGSFLTENVPVPRESAVRAFNVQRFTDLPRGGHFAALGEPELFTADVSEAVKQLTR